MGFALYSTFPIIGSGLLFDGYVRKNTLRGKLEMVAGAALFAFVVYYLSTQNTSTYSNENTSTYSNENTSRSYTKICSSCPKEEELLTTCENIITTDFNTPSKFNGFDFKTHTSFVTIRPLDNNKEPDWGECKKCIIYLNDAGMALFRKYSTIWANNFTDWTITRMVNPSCIFNIIVYPSMMPDI